MVPKAEPVARGPRSVAFGMSAAVLDGLKRERGTGRLENGGGVLWMHLYARVPRVPVRLGALFCDNCQLIDDGIEMYCSSQLLV